MTKLFNRFMALAMLLFLLGCTPEKAEMLQVFLVRHAEKVDQSRDPDLARAGYLRAEELARTLADANIEYVHSSDFIRTRLTAAPVAEFFDLETALYDQNDLLPLAEHLREVGGRHLVVGHSNTTPDLVALLGGDPGYPIEEEKEYDRLYILTIWGNKVNTLLLRYGKPSSSLPSSISASSLELPQISGSAVN